MSKSKKFRVLILLALTIGLILAGFLQQYNELYYGLNQNLIEENRKFEQYVVFYPQHQDDEVLWGGSAIRRAIETVGADHVFVVLVSDGTGVNVFREKIYLHTTRKGKEEFRNKEFYASLDDLGVKKDNTIVLADIDNKSGEHFELMKKVALDFENKYKNVTHIAQSYKFDDHPMHRKNGRIIYKLYKEGEIKDAMFYLKPKYIKNIPLDKMVIYKAENFKDYDAIMDACNEYRIVDSSEGRRGIGYTSAHSYFDHLLRDPNLTSILHLPF